jgi:phage N-6-adenine-methyltransferase
MNDVHFSSKKQDWETPNDLFSLLDEEFAFELDACATKDNAKCIKYFDEEADGLKQSWQTLGKSVYCNPPYSAGALTKWCDKAIEEAARGVRVILLVPARTDTKWWHRVFAQAEEIRLLEGRLKFTGAKFSAPFPSCVVVLRRGKFVTNGSPRVICWDYRRAYREVTTVSRRPEILVAHRKAYDLA